MLLEHIIPKVYNPSVLSEWKRIILEPRLKEQAFSETSLALGKRENRTRQKLKWLLKHQLEMAHITSTHTSLAKAV